MAKYDADGNLISDGRWDYTWDGENRLTQMKTISEVPNAAERRLEFEYDYLGRRVRKKVYNQTTGGTLISDIKFLYDGWNVIAELDGSDTLLQTYVWGLDLSGSYSGAGGIGGLLKVEDHDTGGEGHYVAYDGNGNVVALVSESSGNLTARYEYGPFGEQVRATGSMAVKNPFQFSTKSVDLESGFYYYGMRYYNPTTGRWLNRDPIEEDGGLNLYGFVRNSPFVFFDFLGLDPEMPWHHVFPRQVFTPEFVEEHGLKLDIHDKRNGWEIPRVHHLDLHDEQWNDMWAIWIEERKLKGLPINDKCIRKRASVMRNMDEFKEAFKSGRAPKHGFFDRRRYGKLSGVMVMASLFLSFGQDAALGREIRDWIVADGRGDIAGRDASAGVIGEQMLGLGAPKPFVDWLVFEKLVD